MVCYSVLVTFSLLSPPPPPLLALPLSCSFPLCLPWQSPGNGGAHRGRGQQRGESLKADLRLPDGSTAGQLHRGVHQEPNGAVSTAAAHAHKHKQNKKNSHSHKSHCIARIPTSRVPPWITAARQYIPNRVQPSPECGPRSSSWLRPLGACRGSGVRHLATGGQLLSHCKPIAFLDLPHARRISERVIALRIIPERQTEWCKKPSGGHDESKKRAAPNWLPLFFLTAVGSVQESRVNLRPCPRCCVRPVCHFMGVKRAVYAQMGSVILHFPYIFPRVFVISADQVRFTGGATIQSQICQRPPTMGLPAAQTKSLSFYLCGSLSPIRLQGPNNCINNSRTPL